ncbi:DegT/DnrJ/EryC1/StrS family aminotransferase [Coxiella burnetii]|uniref:Nucleotide-sugar aminotransferase n=1 Tax=Coxiella burnetii (strain RSA 493 / Nine Mile phase I) TaxID=227377 RepID=Q83DB3_COXBU|nr:DegT/DnrJ/EryC1/StrS family aminotransferase [Coxiella burnetii]NP_819845.1 nucleotide-sugar aminotransferase [Coxiella burnetii RSA 493]AAO90359.1 nucleotide-sugar aminotransferase [Coxiella burnetii RSA 493]ABX78601.1 DegT/DnrJ/EryC1/StrS aminotransferase family protein [Coxiella burnetii RSA 331]ACJ19949.1 nucleotide-sugar aminotransferase [Coxiella burnetii CbuK_Q154]AIT62968.1 DegT/DnrJ/EryC1/StrS aminotransferase family protein [Coxiella burnetii str. Namibia]AML49129.1 aminotransfer
MKFIDLNEQYLKIKQAVDGRMQAVLDHGQFIMGPEVKELEARLAEWVGVRHCITVSSGTMALLIALMALGVGPGDEVITSSFSFFATAETIVFLGATPVFVDIDPKTYNIDVSRIEAAITNRTKAIVPVSLYGQCADLVAINAIAERHGLPVIEDGAQSLGATHHGRQSCGFTTIGCTSFFPSKPLGCYGDGGACFTNDNELAQTMRLIRNHGQEKRYHHVRVGLNARFNTLQAAVLLAKLELFADELEQRQRVAEWYSEILGADFVTPYIAPNNMSAFAQYTLRVEQRERVQVALTEAGIPTAIHYPKSLHEQPAIQAYLKTDDHYPQAQAASQQVLSLPFHPYLTKETVRNVCDELLSIVSCKSVNG